MNCSIKYGYLFARSSELYIFAYRFYHDMDPSYHSSYKLGYAKFKDFSMKFYTLFYYFQVLKVYIKYWFTSKIQLWNGEPKTIFIN